MKTINVYIIEKLHINKDVKDPYNYHPKDDEELVDYIKEKIEKEGYGTKDKPLDLNDIDTSEITNMSNLFNVKDGELKDLSENGYFDISKWNVSKVENMYSMFYFSNFDGDLSKWKVNKVISMAHMFNRSKFTGKNDNISRWNVSNVKDMSWMFAHSKFTDKNGSISNWNVKNVENMHEMFVDCPLELNPPKWYKK